MSDTYHQFYRSPKDNSVCVRLKAGDPWTLLEGKGDSQAMKFANQQNKFWRPWIKDALLRRGDFHDDENDTFSRRVKKS